MRYKTPWRSIIHIVPSLLLQCNIIPVTTRNAFSKLKSFFSPADCLCVPIIALNWPFFLLLLCPPHLPLWFCSLFSPLFPFLAHHSPPLTLTPMCIVICEQEIVYTLHSTVCACTVHLFACDWGRQLRGRGTQGTGESRGGLLLCWVWLSLG